MADSAASHGKSGKGSLKPKDGVRSHRSELFRGKTVVRGNAHESRSIRELEAIIRSGSAFVLVDNATLEIAEDLAPQKLGPGNYGVHAQSGKHDGVDFSVKADDERVVARNDKWVLFKHDSALDRTYLLSFDVESTERGKLHEELNEFISSLTKRYDVPIHLQIIGSLTPGAPFVAHDSPNGGYLVDGDMGGFWPKEPRIAPLWWESYIPEGPDFISGFTIDLIIQSINMREILRRLKTSDKHMIVFIETNHTLLTHMAESGYLDKVGIYFGVVTFPPTRIQRNLKARNSQKGNNQPVQFDPSGQIEMSALAKRLAADGKAILNGRNAFKSFEDATQWFDAEKVHAIVWATSGAGKSYFLRNGPAKS